MKHIKNFWKKMMAYAVPQWILAGLMCVGIWFVFITSRYTVRGKEVFKKFNKGPIIFVFWHGRTMMLPIIFLKYGRKGYAVASRHRDGRMMAKLLRTFGVHPIYGSSTEGALSVLRKGARVLREGKLVCISPDGPRGPRMRLKDGALYFAKISGAPLVPACFSCSRPWFQKRWDRYLVATPFSKITCTLGDPIFVDRNTDEKGMSAMADKLERILIKQLQDLDAEFGLPKMEPEDKK